MKYMEDVSIIENETIKGSNGALPLSDLITDLHNEVENMGLSVKIHVQLLSKTNDIQIRHYMNDMATTLCDLIKEHDKGISIGKKNEIKPKEISKVALYTIIQKQIYGNLISENERLFRMEFQFINDTNLILEKRLKEIMQQEDSYQEIVLEMKALLDQFRLGVCNINRSIELQEKMEQLTYQLATMYHLHADIKLYMEVKRRIEEYKNLFNKLFHDSLFKLDMTNFENSLRVKDLMVSKLQYYHNECSEHQKKSS